MVAVKVWRLFQEEVLDTAIKRADTRLIQLRKIIAARWVSHWFSQIIQSYVKILSLYEKLCFPVESC